MIGLIAMGGISTGMLNSCTLSNEYAGNVEKIKLGVATTESSSLVYIAENMGFFKNHGLDVSIRDYEAGVFAANGLVAGEVEVATASEFVLISQIFQKRTDLRVLGSIAKTDNVEVVASKEKGIKEPTDLKGKRIATVRGAAFDFFLETFLNSYGISIRGVQVIDLKPSRTEAAISKGVVDAAITFTPYSYGIKASLGTNMVSWSAQNGQDFYFLLLTKEPFIRTRPLVIERLIKALIDAEKFMENYKAEAKKIIGKRLNLGHAHLDSVWQQSHFEMRLDQDLLILMDAETRWTMEHKLTDSKDMPDYLEFIHMEGLLRVRHEAVSIIH